MDRFVDDLGGLEAEIERLNFSLEEKLSPKMAALIEKELEARIEELDTLKRRIALSYPMAA